MTHAMLLPGLLVLLGALGPQRSGAAPVPEQGVRQGTDSRTTRIAAQVAARVAGTRSRGGIPRLVASAPVSVPGMPSASRVDTLERFRTRTDRTAALTVRGIGLDRVVAVFLVEVSDGVPIYPLAFTSNQGRKLTATAPAGFEAGTYYLVLSGSVQPVLWASIVFVDPPLPEVDGLLPDRGPAHVTTDLRVLGQHLDDASTAFLETPDGGPLPMEQLAVVSPSELQARIPAGLEPGAYRVRVVTPGGISVLTRTFTVDPHPSPPPEVLALDQVEGTNDVARVLTLSGEHFSAATSVFACGAGSTSLTFSVVNETTITATLPAGLPPDLYELVVRTPAGESAGSPARFIVIDLDTRIDFLGDGRAIGVDPETVRLLHPDWLAVVERGRLVFLHNRLTDRTALVDDGEAPGTLGVEWEAPAASAAVGAPTTAWLGASANPAAQGVDFQFAYAGTPLFTLTWGIDSGALTCAFTYDATHPSLPGNVFRLNLGSFGVPATARQLACAFGGLALDWNALSSQLSLAAPEHYELPLLFVEDSAGGGLLVDLTELEDDAALTTTHRRAGPARATRFHVAATPRRALLTQGELGRVRFTATSGGWADAVEAHQASVFNPHAPTWIDQTTSVFRIIGLNRFADPSWSADAISAIDQAVAPGPGVPVPGDQRLLHVVEADEEGLAGVPDWTPSPLFALVGDGLRARGWHVLPYIATPGVQDAHPLFPAWSRHRLASWDKAAQTLAWRFWDNDGDGTCCSDPQDYWLMNVAHAPYRDHLLGQVAAGRAATFPFDGIYFDFMKANTGPDDRNSSCGDAAAGYRDLVQEFLAAFGPGSPAGGEFLIAGEGASVRLTEAGNALAAIHVVEPGLLERDPRGGPSALAFAHPIGTYLVADQCRLSSTSELAMPGWHQAQHHMARLADLIQGAVPTAAALGFLGWKNVSLDADSRRALIQIAEEGLYWRVHGVRPYTDPDPAWYDPETLRLYEVDGAVVARTRSFFVNKLVCDLYWQFGARAPTAAELADLAARTEAGFLGVYAAVCEVREHFQSSPTPAALVQDRAEARAAILQVFPAYPAP